MTLDLSALRRAAMERTNAYGGNGGTLKFLAVCTPEVFTELLDRLERAERIEAAARRALTTFTQVAIDCNAQVLLIEWISEMEDKIAALRAALEPQK